MPALDPAPVLKLAHHASCLGWYMAGRLVIRCGHQSVFMHTLLPLPGLIYTWYCNSIRGCITNVTGEALPSRWNMKTLCFIHGSPWKKAHAHCSSVHVHHVQSSCSEVCMHIMVLSASVTVHTLQTAYWRVVNCRQQIWAPEVRRLALPNLGRSHRTLSEMLGIQEVIPRSCHLVELDPAAIALHAMVTDSARYTDGW